MDIISNLSVLIAATSIDLTVLATVKSDFDITDGAQDAKLARYITQASDILARECACIFAKEKLSEQFRLRWRTPELILARRLNLEILSVTEDDVTLDSSQYEADLQRGILRRLSSGSLSSWHCRKVVVEYWSGYQLLDGLPYGVERAAIDLVGYLRATSGNDPFVKGEQVDIPGVYSERTDRWVGSITEGGGVPPSVAGLIERFRNFAMA